MGSFKIYSYCNKSIYRKSNVIEKFELKLAWANTMSVSALVTSWCKNKCIINLKCGLNQSQNDELNLTTMSPLKLTVKLLMLIFTEII